MYKSTPLHLRIVGGFRIGQFEKRNIYTTIILANCYLYIQSQHQPKGLDMKLTEWKLEDHIKTKEDLVNYLESALEEKDFAYLLIACKDFLDIAKKNKWK